MAADDEPRIEGANDFIGAAVKSGVDLRENNFPRPAGSRSALTAANAEHASVEQPTVTNAPPKMKVKIRTEACNDMGDPACSSARTACMIDAGNSNYFEPPTTVYSSTNGGQWTRIHMYCGVPATITLPDADGNPVEVTVDAPPVPTFAQIQEAYKRLPFSKPTTSIQPVGLKTLVNLPTYYEATWPDDNGLQPGETSEPVQLLSWSVEFKITAKDYRYNFGDGSTSGWTTSTGGAYPDGDITHTYEQTGDVRVSVDARLTGQYRVNGGPWQDIATTADLQDEPAATLQVVGTDTKLVAE